MRAINFGTLALTALMLAACGSQDAVAGQAGGGVGTGAGLGDAAGATGQAGVVAASADGGNGGAMQQVLLVDQQGFGQPTIAARGQIPAGWRPEGGIGWNNADNCVTNQMQVQWRATAPDGLTAFELLPGFSWQIAGAQVPMNPCPVTPWTTAREFLSMVAERMRPGSRILGYKDRPDLARRVQTRPGVRMDAGDLTIAYMMNGQELNEILSAEVSINGGALGATAYVAASRAPAGRLDLALHEKIKGSIKGNPEYITMIGQRGTAAANRFAQQQSAEIQQWHNRRMGEINAAGAAARAGIAAQTSRDVAAINAQTYANTSATNDAIHRDNIGAIREESTWVNPSTGGTAVGSIHGGQRVLDTGNGTFVRTDDPYYNPAGSSEMVPE